MSDFSGRSATKKKTFTLYYSPTLPREHV
uniref:Uncharacterized protein n=1 Tax=Anguilla anguilla TaxID=7936 RepID=A0A0E9V2H9_ANGAN